MPLHIQTGRKVCRKNQTELGILYGFNPNRAFVLMTCHSKLDGLKHAIRSSGK